MDLLFLIIINDIILSEISFQFATYRNIMESTKKNRWHSQISPKAIFSNEGMMESLDSCFGHLQQAMTANFFSLQLLLDIIKDKTTVDQAKLRQIYKIFTNNRANQICFSKNMKELIKINFQSHQAVPRLYARLVQKITLKINYYLLNQKLLGFESDSILDLLKKLSYVVRRITKFKDVKVFTQLTEKLFEETFEIQERIYELLIEKGHILSLDQYFIVNGFDRDEIFHRKSCRKVRISQKQQIQNLSKQVDKPSSQQNTRIWTIKQRNQTYRNKKFIMAEQKIQPQQTAQIENLFSFLLKEIGDKIESIISLSNFSKDKFPVNSTENMQSQEVNSGQQIEKINNKVNLKNPSVIIVPKRNRRVNKNNTTSILVHQNSSFVLPSQNINKPQKISGFFSEHFRETIRSYSENISQNKKGIKLSPEFQLQLQTIMQRQHRNNHKEITENSEESDYNEQSKKENNQEITVRRKKHKLTVKNYSMCQQEEIYRKILEVEESQLTEDQKINSLRSIISKYDVASLAFDDYRKNSLRGLQILRNSLSKKSPIQGTYSSQNIPRSSHIIQQYKNMARNSINLNQNQLQKNTIFKKKQNDKKKLTKVAINRLTNYIRNSTNMLYNTIDQQQFPENLNKTTTCSIIQPSHFVKQYQKKQSKKIFLIQSKTQNVNKNTIQDRSITQKDKTNQYVIKKPFHSFHLSERKYRIYDTRRRVIIV